MTRKFNVRGDCDKYLLSSRAGCYSSTGIGLEGTRWTFVFDVSGTPLDTPIVLGYAQGHSVSEPVNGKHGM
jgi:hypothetical protein